MTYEKLREKEKELNEVRKQLDKIEEEKALELLQTIINLLKEFDEMTGNEIDCAMQVYCDDYERTVDAYIPVIDIVQALKDLKEKGF